MFSSRRIGDEMVTLYDVAIRRHVGEGVAVVAVQVKLLDSTARINDK